MKAGCAVGAFRRRALQSASGAAREGFQLRDVRRASSAVSAIRLTEPTNATDAVSTGRRPLGMQRAHRCAIRVRVRCTSAVGAGNRLTLASSRMGTTSASVAIGVMSSLGDPAVSAVWKAPSPSAGSAQTMTGASAVPRGRTASVRDAGSSDLRACCGPSAPYVNRVAARQSNPLAIVGSVSNLASSWAVVQMDR
jgi:hypothetical protein